MAARLAAPALTALALAAFASSAAAAPVPAGVQAGTVTQAAAPATAVVARKASCNVGIPVIGGVVSTVTNTVCDAGSTVAGAAGSVVGEVGNTVLDGIASWVIDADTTVTTFVEKAMTNTTSPRLEAPWYVAQFAPMAQLGGGMALLVALIAFTSAALRRSPEAIAATLAGIVRAGVGTGVAIPLTTLGLAISDQISAAVVARSPHAFFATVAHAWGASGFGGLGSSALATLIAFVELIGAVAVWLELIVRGAVIYVAVLFFPVALAASIWPKLGDWTGRLSKLLLQFVILKPVALIVLSLAGSAAAAGLSGGAGGITGSVGAILAAVVIFALAAAAPWALMYLLAADAESAWTSSSVRVGASQGLAKAGGGLRSLRPSTSGPGGGAGGGAGGSGAPGGGGTPGPGSPGFPGGGSGGSGGSAAGAGGGAAGGAGGAAGGAAAGGAVGGGAVAAAAGMQRVAGRASATVSQAGQGKPGGAGGRDDDSAADGQRGDGGASGPGPRSAGAGAGGRAPDGGRGGGPDRGGSPRTPGGASTPGAVGAAGGHSPGTTEPPTPTRVVRPLPLRPRAGGGPPGARVSRPPKPRPGSAR
jgi:type IV secretion system protein TrbL